MAWVTEEVESIMVDARQGERRQAMRVTGGVPYAETVRGEDGQWWAICPRCGAYCGPLGPGKDFESLDIALYVEHFMREHEAG